MHQVLMNRIEASNDSVIRLAVTVVIMGNTIAVIMLSGIGIAGRSAFVLFAGKRTTARHASHGLAANPDLSGVNDEEAFIVPLVDHALDDDEFQRFETTSTFGIRGDWGTGTSVESDGGGTGGDSVGILAAVVPGKGAVIFVAHQLA